MKRSDKLRRQAEITMEKIRVIFRHIRNVEENCLLLAEKLLERGEIDLARNLVANGVVHDASKFWGIEWDHMVPGQPSAEEGVKLKLKMAVQHHAKTNSHHPEYWGRIQDMPRIALAECVCDWKARSEEFGTSLRDWIDNDATKKFHFTKEERVYKEITEFVDLLCPKPFENLTQS